MDVQEIKKNNECRLKKITELSGIIEILQKQIAELNSNIYSLITSSECENNTSRYQKKNYLEQHIEKLTKEKDELIFENEKLKKKLKIYNDMFLDPDIDKKQDILCVICESHTRNVLFRPCNHLVICDHCSGSSDFRDCIICKQEIHSYEYAFLV
jgi:regulator of replication initiation timing